LLKILAKTNFCCGILGLVYDGLYSAHWLSWRARAGTQE
jgi:hypothetical protein